LFHSQLVSMKAYEPAVGKSGTLFK